MYLFPQINGQDVSQASHERVVAIIRQSGDLVSMTVVTVVQQSAATLPSTEKPQLINRQCATLPRKLSTKKGTLKTKYFKMQLNGYNHFSFFITKHEIKFSKKKVSNRAQGMHVLDPLYPTLIKDKTF